MSDLITALTRLHAFRSTWEDGAQIDKESELTAADPDTILAAAEGPADLKAGGSLTETTSATSLEAPCATALD